MIRLKKQKPPQAPTEYPIGTFVHTETGYYLIMRNGVRNVFTSERVLRSYAPLRIIETSDAALLNYRIGFRLKFRNNSLLKNIADGKIYLIEEGKRRHITSPDILKTLGATWDDVVLVSRDEINLHEDGEPL